MSTTNSTFIVTPVISDNVKDAWNKLVNDVRGTGVIADAIVELREGVTEIAEALKTDLQAAGATVGKDIHTQFAAFETTSSAGMNDATKAIYLKLLNNADADLTKVTNQAVADVWKETSDLSASINKILDNAISNPKTDITTLANQVYTAIKTEFGDLVNDMQSNLTANYQKTLADVTLAAGAIGISVDKTALTTLGNNIVSAVAADMVVSGAKIGVDVTSELLEMTADVSSAVLAKKDSLLKIAIVDGLNLIQAVAKVAWKAIKKWFKW
ncbi:MAG: hypothetical protein WCV63_05000 [Negativicutes bacterium]|jgi:hypothetical protein